MKKLTPIHIVLIALLVVVVAVTVYFSSNYRSAEAKQPEIQDQIVLATKKLALAKEQNNAEPLKQQLANLEATLQVLVRKDPLVPVKPASVKIGDLVVDSAHKLGLTLLKLSPNDTAGTVTIKATKDSKGTKYNKAEYSVRVKGDLGRINSLIGDIEGADFATLTIEDTTLTWKESTVQDVTVQYWEAEFTVVTLYQYKETK